MSDDEKHSILVIFEISAILTFFALTWLCVSNFAHSPMDAAAIAVLCFMASFYMLVVMVRFVIREKP